MGREARLGPGWIVNLEPNYNLTLGAVGIVDGRYLSPETTLEQRGVSSLKLSDNQRRNDTPWYFNSNDRFTLTCQ